MEVATGEATAAARVGATAAGTAAVTAAVRAAATAAATAVATVVATAATARVGSTHEDVLAHVLAQEKGRDGMSNQGEYVWLESRGIGRWAWLIVSGPRREASGSVARTDGGGGGGDTGGNGGVDGGGVAPTTSSARTPARVWARGSLRMAGGAPSGRHVSGVGHS